MPIGALGTRPRVTCDTALRTQTGLGVTSPPLQPRPSESRQVPRLSDLTHLPPFGAQLASQEEEEEEEEEEGLFKAEFIQG